MIFIGALVLVAAEIVAFVLVAHQIGWLLALVALVAASALGPFLVRRAGFGILAHARDTLARGELPTRELLDGLAVLVAGVMICVPGFIGDAMGLLLMVGPVRHAVIRGFGHRLARRVQRSRVARWRVVDTRPVAPGPD